jgi:hypothetical protein
MRRTQIFHGPAPVENPPSGKWNGAMECGIIGYFIEGAFTSFKEKDKVWALFASLCGLILFAPSSIT